MKKVTILFFVAACAWAQQSFDFSTLDKLGAKAKNKTAATMQYLAI